MDYYLEIKKVFESRKSVRKEVRTYNSNVLYGLDQKFSDEEMATEVVHCTCAHPNLLNKLFGIIEDCEELQICIYATNILYNILIKSNDEEKQVIKKVLYTAEYFSQILQCAYNVHDKFSKTVGYNDSFPNIHIKLFHFVSIVYPTKKCRKLSANIDEQVVKFIGNLLVGHHVKKELASHLMSVLKLVCLQKKYCEFLTHQEFFDSLCVACKITQKVATTVFILKAMSRNAIALQCMADNKRLIKFILNIISHSGKRIINVRNIMTVLYKITAIEVGLKVFLEVDGFNTLYNYFMNGDNHRLSSVKAYTILNRTLVKATLPSSYSDAEFYEHYDENNSSSDGAEMDDDSDNEIDNNDECDLYISDQYVTDYQNNCIKDCGKNDANEVGMFFGESFNNSVHSELDILKGMPECISALSKSWQEVVESRVNSLKGTNRQAFPDTLLLDACNQEHYLNISSNNFSVEYLGYKLQCLKGNLENTYKPQIVYNRDTSSTPHIPNAKSLVDFLNENHKERQSLQFESRFESGNLMTVRQVGNFEYELLLTSDTHSSTGHQWFYFQVSNMIAGVVYIFNIVNFLKINSQYNYGMQPVMFSLVDYLKTKSGWKRCGEKIIYYGNNYTDENRTKQYTTLSFWITFPYDNDYVYLAYHYPYTYTRLLMVLSNLTKNNLNNISYKIEKLCNTVSCKNEVPLVTITSASKNSFKQTCPLIFITSRVHPGETNSSWIMEGIIKFLLNDECEQAVQARENFVFKLIPMLNPEGVIYGNTRTGLNGIDLNRCWLKPNPSECPEIYYTKQLIKYAKQVLKQSVSFYIDIHGHSKKKFFFFYGCNPALSWNNSDAKNDDIQDALNIFPQMVQRFNPHIRLTSCKYKIQKSKESTGRVVAWREFDIQHSYTLECSYCSGANQQTINTKILSDIGASVVAALSVMVHDSEKSPEFLKNL